MPTRGVTGPTWQHREVDPRHTPEQWNTIHFHDDDLDDAEWEPSFSFDLPVDLPSGVYAARLASGSATDHVPFIVRPTLGSPTADVLLVMPTFSYLAYANERAHASPGYQEQMRSWGMDEQVDDDYDGYIKEHRLKSLYASHSDGSGVCYSSSRRPLLNMRPGQLMRVLNRGQGSPHQFNADLHIVKWLRDHDVAFDVATDADLDRDGEALLNSYRVVMTGSHAEYWSENMLDGLDRSSMVRAGSCTCPVTASTGSQAWTKRTDTPSRCDVSAPRAPRGKHSRASGSSRRRVVWAACGDSGASPRSGQLAWDSGSRNGRGTRL